MNLCVTFFKAYSALHPNRQHSPIVTMVKELSITLNSEPLGGNYSPGSTISGSLTIEVDEAKDYKTLAVNFLGKGRVHWSEGSNENRRTYFASEEYVNETLVLWKSEDSPDGTFPVGRYTYPFEFVLPATCPSSYSSPIGKISYEVEGRISTGLLKFDHTVKHPFNVCELVSVEPSNSVRFEKRKTVGCGLCVSGEVSYSVQLPSTGYTAGEEIPVSWYVENGSGRRVTLRCSLKEKIMYFARGGTNRIIKTLATQSGITVPPHGMSGDTTMQFTIPPCRPALTCSNIIKSEFFIVATVVIPRAINSNIDIPVTIGNVSFQQ